MRYLWTEDRGAGFHYWQLVNKYLFNQSLIVESKGSNQGLLDAVRCLAPTESDIYYIAFDIVYDNMDIMNKYLELQELLRKYPMRIVLLDITCFEYIILSFKHLIEWTGTGRKDKVSMREHLLTAFENHRIDIDSITNQKTLNYLMGFKHYSTEKVLKSITNELTDNDRWSIREQKMGECWHENCCVLDKPETAKCNLKGGQSGTEKIMGLLRDEETQRIVAEILLEAVPQ